MAINIVEILVKNTT